MEVEAAFEAVKLAPVEPTTNEASEEDYEDYYSDDFESDEEEDGDGNGVAGNTVSMDNGGVGSSLNNNGGAFVQSSMGSSTTTIGTSSSQRTPEKKRNRRGRQMPPSSPSIRRGGNVRKNAAKDALGKRVYDRVVKYYTDNGIIEGLCKLPSKHVLEQLSQIVGGKANLKYCKMVEESLYFEQFK